MNALWLKEPHVVEMIETEQPVPGEGEVLVRVSRAALCGSEVMGWHGRHFGRKPPVITGHEMSGVVAGYGPGVHEPPLGTRVAVMPQIGCGVCDWCRDEQTNLCPQRLMLGFQAWSGAFAEYVVARADLLHPLPDSLSDEAGSLVEPLAVGAHAVRRLGVRPGDTVLVLGAGAIGLTVVLAAHAAGAERILASDLFDFNLDLARKAGASHTHKVGEADLQEAVRELTGGVGVDHVVLAAEAPGLPEAAVRAVRRQGRIAVLASYDENVPVPLQLLKSKEALLMGSVTYTPEDFRQAVRLATTRCEAVSAMVTHVMPLCEAKKGFQLMDARTENVVRVVFAI